MIIQVNKAQRFVCITCCIVAFCTSLCRAQVQFGVNEILYRKQLDSVLLTNLMLWGYHHTLNSMGMKFLPRSNFNLTKCERRLKSISFSHRDTTEYVTIENNWDKLGRMTRSVYYYGGYPKNFKTGRISILEMSYGDNTIHVSYRHNYESRMYDAIYYYSIGELPDSIHVQTYFGKEVNIESYIVKDTLVESWNIIKSGGMPKKILLNGKLFGEFTYTELALNDTIPPILDSNIKIPIPSLNNCTRIHGFGKDKYLVRASRSTLVIEADSEKYYKRKQIVGYQVAQWNNLGEVESFLRDYSGFIEYVRFQSCRELMRIYSFSDGASWKSSIVVGERHYYDSREKRERLKRKYYWSFGKW